MYFLDLGCGTPDVQSLLLARDISYKLIKFMFLASLHLLLNSKDHKIMNQCLKYHMPTSANKINVFSLFIRTYPQFDIKNLYKISLLNNFRRIIIFLFNPR